MQRIRRVRELTDGYAFGLDPTESNEACAREFVAFESKCCGFANYAVERDEAEPLIWLSVRGPGGTKEFARELAPTSISIERMQAGERGGTRTLLRAGIAGASTALIAIVCCVTPILPVALGVMGLGAAVASLWLDVVAAPLLLISLLAIGFASWRMGSASQA